MENYPKIRSPEGTYVAVENRNKIHIMTLDMYLDLFSDYKLHVIALTKQPLKSWKRSWEFHKKLENNKK